MGRAASSTPLPVVYLDEESPSIEVAGHPSDNEGGLWATPWESSHLSERCLAPACAQRAAGCRGCILSGLSPTNGGCSSCCRVQGRGGDRRRALWQTPSPGTVPWAMAEGVTVSKGEQKNCDCLTDCKVLPPLTPHSFEIGMAAFIL